MDNEMSDLESKKLNSSSYEYDHSDWPRDFDFSVECSEQKEVLSMRYGTKAFALHSDDCKVCP